MRITTAIVSMVALSAGALGGSAAYQLASADSGPGPSTAGTTAPPAEETPAAVVRGTRFGWEPCQAPAVRQGRACVTEVVRTVVLPAPAPAPAPAVALPPEAASAYVDDGGNDDEFEDDAYDDDSENDDSYDGDSYDGDSYDGDSDDDDRDEDDGRDDEDEDDHDEDEDDEDD